MRKSVGVGVVAAVCAVAAATGFSFLHVPINAPYAEAATIAGDNPDARTLASRFQALAQKRGGVYAYEVLRRAGIPPGIDTHHIGHVIGEVLYEQKGIEGIVACTHDFRNACSHTIAIGALREFGDSGLAAIREVCAKAPGGSGAYAMCFHGLGHGVLASHGYDLAKAVDFCRLTGTAVHENSEYVECIGGVVMELVGGGGHDAESWLSARNRYFESARPLAPCRDAFIPDDAKAQCLFYLTPRLWELSGVNLSALDTGTFAKAFTYCEALPSGEVELRDACFGGFGKEFVVIAGGRDVRDVGSFSDDVFGKAIGWCGLAAPEDGQRACVSEAVASVFWGGENDPEAAFRFCSLMRGSTRDACYARLAEDIAGFTAGSRRAELCALMPAGWQPQCLQSD